MLDSQKKELKDETDSKIYADFNNRDAKGRVRFTNGTFRVIARLNIELKP